VLEGGKYIHALALYTSPAPAASQIRNFITEQYEQTGLHLHPGLNPTKVGADDNPAHDQE
jgi:hypothetical protein